MLPSRAHGLLVFTLALFPRTLHAVNHTLVHRTPLDVKGARVRGFESLPLSEGLYRTTGERAVLTSAVYETPHPFDDLVGSWNAVLPKESVLKMEVRAKGSRRWSPWFLLGEQGERFTSPPRQEGEHGYVDTDTLKLKRPATALQYRVTIETPSSSATLKLIAVTVTDGKSPARPPAFRPGPWVRELKVRSRSQKEESPEYGSKICNPTTLAMVFEFWGVKVPTMRLARRVQDAATDIFGDWSFSVAAAGTLGLEGYVARLESLEDLQNEIAAGRPVGVSITYKAGELGRSPISSTQGHILLVTGFTKAGNVIVRDPAAKKRSGVRRVYDRAQFHRVWRIRKSGLAYMIGPGLHRKMTVGVPFTDLRTEPREPKKFLQDDPGRLSQLLYGETVTVLKIVGEWAKVLADEQPDFRKGKKWQGYPGWVRASTLHYGVRPAPDSVVGVRRVRVRARGRDLILSLGTRLPLIGGVGKTARAHLLDGRIAEIPYSSLTPPGTKTRSALRQGILKTASLFLGSRYFWGGRSGIQRRPYLGVDCSGLTNLAYRAHGLTIPRDAHEQWLKSLPRKSSGLEPGDLIFLTKSAKDKTVTHVMLYTGEDAVIESRESAGKTLRATFKKRFGSPLSSLSHGQTVTDLTFDPPRRRVIYFGSYLAPDRK